MRNTSHVHLWMCPVTGVLRILLCAGLPVGLQIVGPPGADALVLAEAAAFEQAHMYKQQVPRDIAVC
jgi:Asp-tRNA(Asn)/Glu-tRNA(Gln) amidotransferase A subunit family amidase